MGKKRNFFLKKSSHLTFYWLRSGGSECWLSPAELLWTQWQEKKKKAARVLQWFLSVTQGQNCFVFLTLFIFAVLCLSGGHCLQTGKGLLRHPLLRHGCRAAMGNLSLSSWGRWMACRPTVWAEELSGESCGNLLQRDESNGSRFLMNRSVTWTVFFRPPTLFTRSWTEGHKAANLSNPVWYDQQSLIAIKKKNSYYTFAIYLYIEASKRHGWHNVVAQQQFPFHTNQKSFILTSGMADWLMQQNIRFFGTKSSRRWRKRQACQQW